MAEIVARRGRVLEDAVAQILPLGSAARGRLAVRYVNAAGFEEAGIDAGGLFKELLADACGAGFDPARGIFAATAENLAFPAARAGDTAEGVAILELVGVLVGKGLYEGVLQETRFAPHFAKYLLGAPRTMDDLASLDPELRRSLALVLRHDGDVEDLCLDWTAREERFGAVETHELRPGGADRVVTNDDRLAYVHAVADFHLNRRRGAADAALRQGLARIVQPGWLRLFSPPELSQLVSGAEEADVDILDLRKHARYSGGYTETSRAVLAFWEVVRGFTPEERRGLLKFVTSSSRPPASGFRHLHPPFTVHKVRCEAPSVFSAFAGPDVDRFRRRGVFQRAQTAELQTNEHHAGEDSVRRAVGRGVRTLVKDTRARRESRPSRPSRRWGGSRGEDGTRRVDAFAEDAADRVAPPSPRVERTENAGEREAGESGA